MIMKRENKSEKMTGKLDHFLSGLSDNEILSLTAMRHVRGGTGEGWEDSPIIPPPPGQQ
jgi:hypothetical protein